jgi:N-methylhydantoinase A
MPVQGVTYRVQLVVPADKVEYVGRDGGPAVIKPSRTIELHHFAGGVLEADEYRRETLPPGTRVAGPAVIREALSTTLVFPGQIAQIGRFGEIVIEQREGLR